MNLGDGTDTVAVTAGGLAGLNGYGDAMENSFCNELLTCKPEELLFYFEKIFDSIKTESEAEAVIRLLWKRVPELTEKQEKDIHRLGRKLRKKFGMKPVKVS